VGVAIGQFEAQLWRIAQRTKLGIMWALRERDITLGSHQGRKEIHKGSQLGDLGQFWRAFPIASIQIG